MTEKEKYTEKVLNFNLRKEHEEGLLLGLENEYECTTFIINQMVNFIF